MKSNLEANFAIMQKWFYENTVLNPGKWHYVLIENHDKLDKINLNEREITISNNQKLLDVLTDKRLSFDVQIKTLCKKARQNLSAVTTTSSCLTLDQKLLLINSVVK